MNASATTVFVSRIKGLPVLDASGDQVGKVRDVVIQNRTSARPPHVKGLVIELLRLRRVYLPMQRVHAVDAQQVIISGAVNTVAFARREHEHLVIADLFDRRVSRPDQPAASIFDVAIAQTRTRAWEVVRVALRETTGRRPFVRGHVVIVDWRDVPDVFSSGAQGTEQLLARLVDMKPADVARELHDLAPERRRRVIDALEDDVLAEAMEELPEAEQVIVLSALDTERAADILEEMDPDDAADLIAELTPEMAETLLQRMEPDDAQDVRALLSYAPATAGGLMTPEPIVVGPDATVAECLALVRAEEITPALAALTFVCRPPLDTPTGRYLGAVHIQRLLREPPSTLAAELFDAAIEPLPPDTDVALVSRYFATYDFVCAPVVDDDGRLLGAVTVDDVLDHILPDDWRGLQLAAGVNHGTHD
ncbi:MAG: magnesium transporter MgtE N-terminal domain-containing protein [Propioniciclava sp.]